MNSPAKSRSNSSSSSRGVRRARPDRGRLIRWFFFLVVLIVIYWQGPRLLRTFGEWWVVNEPLESADAILVLEDDSYGGLRCRRAAELYREGWSPRVVASGRYLRPYASLADVMRRDLVEHGVPESAIVTLPHSPRNMLNEAEATRALVTARGWKRVLIVTSNYQTRRSRRFYRRALDGVAEVRVVATPDPGFNPAAWWRHRSSIAMVARECIYFFTAE